VITFYRDVVIFLDNGGPKPLLPEMLCGAENENAPKAL
jgi:hypothetical protein